MESDRVDRVGFPRESRSCRRRRSEGAIGLRGSRMADPLDPSSWLNRLPVISNHTDGLSSRPRRIDRVGSTSPRLRVHSGGLDTRSDALASTGSPLERELGRVRWSARSSDSILRVWLDGCAVHRTGSRWSLHSVHLDARSDLLGWILRLSIHLHASEGGLDRRR